MEPQPDQWTKNLPDDREVVYTSNIGLESVGGPITAQVGDITHTDIATQPMSRQEIEAAFAGALGPVWKQVNLSKVREEHEDKLALERHLSHADMHPSIYNRLEKRGYFKDGEITDEGKRLIAGAK